MGIPHNITRTHVINAIKEIASRGVPEEREATRYVLRFEGADYPPKYVVRIANRYANGYELSSGVFNGGGQTNNFLRNRGFQINEKPGAEKETTTVPQPVSGTGVEKSYRSLLNTIFGLESPDHNESPVTSPSGHGHNERCPACKDAVRTMLEQIYGQVHTNYTLPVGTHPEDFTSSPYYETLKTIYGALQKFRGHSDFVHAKTLPPVDYYAPDQNLIVEFDESQHFTAARAIALSNYPAQMALGFDKDKWMKLCTAIDAHDNDPPYRDEQRAWYDTLRDFVPIITGMRPTHRLFAKDSTWCTLNTGKENDVESFFDLLPTRSTSHTGISPDSNPFSARIIIADEWEGKLEEAKILLNQICLKWPAGKKVKFLMTCGGFIEFEWPVSLSKRHVGDVRYPDIESVVILVKQGEQCARNLLDQGLGTKLARFADFITLGVDSYKTQISTTQTYIGQLHTELVFLVDLKRMIFHWTGKSYPTSKQQNGLVRIADLSTHFFQLDGIGKVLILGCHDLTVFNPRSKNASGWRENVNEEFRQRATTENPTVVLHHPHTTDSIRTWGAAWSGLKRELSNVYHYASAGRYFFNAQCAQRDEVSKVLRSTASCDTIDFLMTCSNQAETFLKYQIWREAYCHIYQQEWVDGVSVVGILAILSELHPNEAKSVEEEFCKRVIRL